MVERSYAHASSFRASSGFGGGPSSRSPDRTATSDEAD